MRKILEELSYTSQKIIPNKELEHLLVSEENEHLRSPGIPAHYYRFFYFLVEKYAPLNILELGTYTGISAYALADKNIGGQVISVDHTEGRLLAQCKLVENAKFIICDSLQKVDIEKIDILFIDTLHDGKRCQAEFDLYEKNVVPGGIIFFDDVYLNNDMRTFWENFNPEKYEKFDLPVHGNAGFGTLIKERSE